RHGAQGLANNVLRVFGIAVQVVHDLGYSDRIMSGIPAVVIGDHGDGGVTDLGLARELGLSDVGHADDVEAQLPVHVRFGEGWELRPFHADVRAVAVDLDTGAVAGFGQQA